MLEGIVAGLVAGSAYAIIAVCIVVLNRLVGVVNISQAAIGALGAYSTYALVGVGMHLWVAVAAGLTLSAVVAAGSGWAMAHWFESASDLVRAVVTVTLLILFLTAGFRLFGNHPRTMPSLVPDTAFTIAGVAISLTTVVALIAVTVIAGAVTLMLRTTHLGLRLRAMAERPRTVQELGINAHRLALTVWAAMGSVSALALLLVAPVRNPTFGAMSLLIVPALAAALIGALSNVWFAALAGLALGALEGVGARIDVIADYRDAIPFVVIILALVWLRRREEWDEIR